MKLSLQRLILVLLLPPMCYSIDTRRALRGRANASGSSAFSSFLCHVMEMHAEYLSLDTTTINTNSTVPLNATYDHDFVCETTPINDSKTTTATATWIYRIKNLPLNFYHDLTLDQQRHEQTWVQFSGVLRNDAAATLELLPNATMNFVPEPSSMVGRSATTTTTTTSHNDEDLRNRKLTTTYQNMGVNYILVVRVTWRNIAPKVTADELRGRIFGMGNRGYTLRRQLWSCSFGKLLMAPAPPIHYSDRLPGAQPIVKGVMDMHLFNYIAPDLLLDSVKILENHVMDNLVQWYGSYLTNQVNHIMIVLPEHNDVQYKDGKKLIAYAYLKTKLSVYSNYWAISIPALAHELGHNFGLQHAGEGSLAYGDTTGSMGYGIGHRTIRTFCYNAQKNWFLRWYEDRALSLTMPFGPYSPFTFQGFLPWTGTLAAFVDYKATTADQPVLLKINSIGQNKRLYLQWNRAKKFNQGTREYRDDVVIVEDSGDLERHGGVQSWLVGAIEPPRVGEIASGPFDHTWNITNFASQTLYIQICQQVRTSRLDHLLISIFPEGYKSGCPSTPTTTTTTTHLSDCEDSPPGTMFWIRKNKPNQRQRDCVWLSRRSLEEREQLCQYNDDIDSAYHSCPETCGKCVDDCEDDPDVQIRINATRGKQSCQWLSNRPLWKEMLCKPGSDAWKHCRESCNNC